METLTGQGTCAPRDWQGKYWLHEPCAACEAWADEHAKLIDALRLTPWQDVQDPDEPCPYPPDSAVAAIHENNRKLEAEALCRSLAAAAAGGATATGPN